jgi:hypothetical protein
MKIVIAPESGDSQHPYRHLQPIVDFLATHGNDLTTDSSGFYLTQGGWVCDFRYPIDYALVDAAFALPPTVRFGEKVNAILCDRSWVEIRGNVV